MMIVPIVFYIFSLLAIASATSVVFAKNPVHAVLSLVATFFCMAAIWIILQAEFLGLILVLVYVGAVMTLFLFVVMMLNIQQAMFHGHFVKYLPGALLAAILLFLLIGSAILPRYFGVAHYPHPMSSEVSNVSVIGKVLYTQYVYPFELAGVILLVGMIAAITLSHRESRTSKRQKPGQQVKVHKADRLRIIKMKAEKKP